jgi:hypothetical protein
MKNVRAACLCLLLASISVSGQGNHTVMTFDTGNNFLAACETPKDEPTNFACRYYVFGVADGIAFTQPSDKPVYCLDSHATMAQERNIVIRFMQTHPERTHIATAALISEALRDAFPCHASK